MPGQIYLVTFTVHARRKLFVSFDRAARCARQLHRVAPAHGAGLLAWVLMPDHAHILVALGDGESLSRWVGRIKAAMARAVHEAEPWIGPVWARGFHDHALRCEESLLHVARYIVLNPVRANLVRCVGDYPFWDAAWL